MKTKFSDIQDKTVEELNVMLTESRLKLGKLIFDLKSKTLKTVSDVGATRKRVAQILTALNNLAVK